MALYTTHTNWVYGSYKDDRNYQIKKNNKNNTPRITPQE